MRQVPFPAHAPRAKILDMHSRPIAYHITFGTYGTRLHGDPRGTVDRSMNQPGDPIIGADAGWWEMERNKLKFDPVILTPEQMCFVESVLPSICERGGWELHTGAGGPDHVHNLITAEADGEAVRKWLKRWLGEALSSEWPRPDASTWWAEGGSTWTHDYYQAVFGYVDAQRASGPTVPDSRS